MTRSIHIIPAARPALHGDRAGLQAPGVLGALTLPVLLIEGAETHPVMFDVTRGLERRLPDARTERVEGAGHMVPVTHPGATAALLREFWQSRSPL